MHPTPPQAGHGCSHFQGGTGKAVEVGGAPHLPSHTHPKGSRSSPPTAKGPRGDGLQDKTQ